MCDPSLDCEPEKKNIRETTGEVRIRSVDQLIISCINVNLLVVAIVLCLCKILIFGEAR